MWHTYQTNEYIAKICIKPEEKLENDSLNKLEQMSDVFLLGEDNKVLLKLSEEYRPEINIEFDEYREPYLDYAYYDLVEDIDFELEELKNAVMKIKSLVSTQLYTPAQIEVELWIKYDFCKYKYSYKDGKLYSYRNGW